MNYVFKNGNVLGPLSDQKIIELLETHSIEINDFVYSESSKNWLPAFQLPLLSKHYTSAPPTIIPNGNNTIAMSDSEIKKLSTINPKTKSDIKIPKDLLEKEWFVLRKHKKHGPFKYLDVIKMLGTNSLFDHDYIWNRDFKSWNKISDLKAFSSYYINQVKHTYLPELGNIFFRRKHNRIPYSAKVFVHNNETFWTGTGNDLSPAGTSITMECKGDVKLLPGDTVNLHFKSEKNIPTFNVKAEIVSKWYKDQNFNNSPLCYSFKFNNINKNIEDFLSQLCSEEHKAA